MKGMALIAVPVLAVLAFLWHLQDAASFRREKKELCGEISAYEQQKSAYVMLVAFATASKHVGGEEWTSLDSRIKLCQKGEGEDNPYTIIWDIRQSLKKAGIAEDRDIDRVKEMTTACNTCRYMAAELSGKLVGPKPDLEQIRRNFEGVKANLERLIEEDHKSQER